MIKVAVTGGIGSGKTTVCNLLQRMGYPVFNADVVGKTISNTDEEVKKSLIKHFSPAIYTPVGELDRLLFASIIFNNPVQLAVANSIIHPAVCRAFETWASQCTSDFVFIESAIVLESILADKMDKIIVVTASEEERISRVIHREGASVEQIKARIKNQLSEQELRKKADFVIDNSDSVLLIPQVEQIIETLRSTL